MPQLDLALFSVHFDILIFFLIYIYFFLSVFIFILIFEEVYIRNFGEEKDDLILLMNLENDNIFMIF